MKWLRRLWLKIQLEKLEDRISDIEWKLLCHYCGPLSDFESGIWEPEELRLRSLRNTLQYRVAELHARIEALR